MLSDLKFALRQLAKKPGFAVVAVLSLAIGIGVNATMFHFMAPVVVRPFLGDRIEDGVAIYTAVPGANRNFREFSYPELAALRASKEVFSQVEALDFNSFLVGRAGNLWRSYTAVVSSGYLGLMGARPLQGRFFSEEEGTPNANIPVVITSEAFWRRLGGDSQFVGSQILVNGRPFTVVGIVSDNASKLPSARPELWLPLGIKSGVDPRSYYVSLIGRLQPGLTLAAARARLSAIDSRLNAPPLGVMGSPRQLMITPLPRFSFAGARPVDESGLAPFGFMAVGLSLSVLLVASLNLANMVLARGVERQKETAIRLSLGASRGHLLRQSLAESALVAAAGVAAGQLLGAWCSAWVNRATAAQFAAAKFDPPPATGLGWADAGLGLALGLGAMLVFGLAPALRLTHPDLVGDLKRQPGQPSEGGRPNRFFSGRHLRMMGQIALSFMLLSSAGLFLRGVRGVLNAPLGFTPQGELVFDVDYSASGAPRALAAAKAHSLLAHVASFPGVAAAALSTAVPFNQDGGQERAHRAGGAFAAGDDAASGPVARCITTVVSSGYFRTVGIAVLKGRDFTPAEGSQRGGPGAGLIDEQLARSLFGDADPLGQRVSTDDSGARDSSKEFEVIGIVRSPSEFAFDASPPQRVYRPAGQMGIGPNVYLHVAAVRPGASSALLDGLRRDLLRFDPDLPLLWSQPLADIVQHNVGVSQAQLFGLAFGSLGIIALLLAAFGVYGVKAHAVASRTREFGIRMALGAKASDVLALVLRQGALQTAAGIGAGLVLALLAGVAQSRSFYHTNAADPVAWAVAFTVLAAAALLACWLPARRATRIDPAVTLKAE